jgi:hypothetical protein
MIVQNKNKVKKTKNYLKSIVIFISILIFFILGTWVERYDFRGKFEFFISELIQNTSTKIYSNFYKVETINLDIKQKHLDSMKDSREKAIEYGRLKDDFVKWVPAKLSNEDITFKVKVKLKGTHSDHWNDPKKWSFNVKVRGDESIYNLKYFALQHPKTLSYLYEWLFMKFLENEQLISYKMKFVNLKVNGDSLGVYSLIEQPSKILVERNKRREGVIIGFDKNIWIEEIQNQFDLGANSIQENFWRTPIKPVRFKDEYKDTKYKKYLDEAVTKINLFRNKDSSIKDTFDENQLAKVLAIKAIFATSEFDWKDLKFYYNPITKLLEPISREAHAYYSDNAPISFWAFDTSKIDLDWQREFLDILFEDLNFYEKYLEELKKISSDEYWDKIIQNNNEEFKKYKILLKRSYPNVEIYSKKHFLLNRKYINDTLNPIITISANLQEINNENIIVNISNKQILPVKIIGLKIKNKKILLEDYKILLGKKQNKLSIPELLKINCKAICEQNNLDQIKLIYRILGDSKDKFISISFWKNSMLNSDDDKIDYFKKITENNNFLIKKNDIFINTKEFNIIEKIVIPKGYRLIINPGTKLIFEKNSSLISYSPILSVGSKEKPIIIKTNFNKSLNEFRERNIYSEEYGEGILVLNTNKKSLFTNTIFRNLSSPNSESINGLSGSLNFYNTNVEIINSKFFDNIYGDDYVNIIKSNFLIKDSYFENTNADALDVDFSNGKILDSTFNNSINDSVDFSGSNVLLDNVKIFYAGDKAISAGEQSKINISNSYIQTSHFGIVAKDKSIVEGNNIIITNNDIGIAAYIKKSEYGPAEIKLINSQLEKNEINIFNQKLSKININNKNIDNISCKNEKKVCNYVLQK